MRTSASRYILEGSVSILDKKTQRVLPKFCKASVGKREGGGRRLMWVSGGFAYVLIVVRVGRFVEWL